VTGHSCSEKVTGARGAEIHKGFTAMTDFELNDMVNGNND
jgi:hypothetical protein